MADEIVTPAATVTPSPEVKAAEPAVAVTPAPETVKTAPADAAAVAKPEEGVAKKSTLLGEDPEAKPAEGEKKEPDATAKVVPESYTVKVPEGMKVDTELLTAVTPIFKELGITQEGAQKLVDAYAPHVAALVKQNHDAAMKSFDAQIETWGKETKAMLGPDADKQTFVAKTFISKVAGKEAPAFRQLLTDTGLGNHPLMVKFLINAGKMIGQDSFVDGGNVPGDNTEEGIKRKFYPNSK